MSLDSTTVTVPAVLYTPAAFTEALTEAFGIPESADEPSALERIAAELVQNPHFAIHDIGIALDYLDNRIFVHVLHHPASGFNGQVAVRVDLTERSTVSRLLSIAALQEEAAKLAEPSPVLALAAALVDATNTMLAEAAEDLGLDFEPGDSA